MNQRTLRWARAASAAAALALVIGVVPAGAQYHDYDHSRGHTAYNDEYIFGFTRAAAEMDAPPPVRIVLFPATVVLDVVLLPAEVIGGFFG